MRALFLASDNFEDMEYYATRDVLRRAGIETVTAEARIQPAERIILGREKAEIVERIPLAQAQLDTFDLLVIPGGGHWVELAKNPEVARVIQWFAARPEKYIAAICAAPTILGAMGLLKGHRYTCFPSMNRDFGGTFIQRYAVVDGHLITGDGPAACVTFGLAIVRATLGAELARKVANEMYFERFDEEVLGA